MPTLRETQSNNRKVILSRIQQYKQNLRPEDIEAATNLIEDLPLAGRTRRALRKKLPKAVNTVNNKLLALARKTTKQSIHDVRASLHDYRVGRAEVRHELIRAAYAAVNRIPDAKARERSLLIDRLNQYRKYIKPTIVADIPYPFPDPPSADLIDRVRARNETVSQVLQRSHIRNVQERSGEWAYAIRLRFSFPDNRVRYGTITSSKTSLARGLYAVIEDGVDAYFEKYHAESGHVNLAFDQLHIVPFANAHSLKIKMRSENLQLGVLGKQIERTGQCVFDLILKQIEMQPAAKVRT